VVTDPTLGFLTVQNNAQGQEFKRALAKTRPQAVGAKAAPASNPNRRTGVISWP
jgi:hypothetical protein